MKKVVFWLIFLLWILLAGLIVISTSNISNGYRFFAVQSGSMEPAIKIGSLIVIRKSNDYQKGEIVTYHDKKNPQITTTHRIVEIKNGFVTRGDANNTNDSNVVAQEFIVGKVILVIPFLGYPISFAKTLPGLIILIIIPSTVIVYSEVLNIKKEIKSKIFKILTALILIGSSQIGLTNAYFTDTAKSFNNAFGAGDWTPPTSSVVNLPTYENKAVFDIYYLAGDSISGVDKVQLYYSYENGNWQLFTTNTIVDGKFQFTSPNGDGFYQFKTVAFDKSSNEEDEDKNGLGDSLDLMTPPVVLPPDASTTVDTKPPVTMLSVQTPLAVANELLYNGGFENGHLDGWVATGSGDHQATTEDKKTSTYSALIGFMAATPSAEPVYDSIKQNISLPSWISSTLSFWYRLMTNSNVSGGFFEATIKRGTEEIKVAHDGWDDPTILNTDLGWKNVTHQLTGLEGQNIDLQFRVIQPYANYQTWAYLDDIRAITATNSATIAAQLTLASNDGGGSNNATINYTLDNNSPATYSGTPITLETPGSHTLKYSSIDEAGNIEPEKQIVINATSSAQVDFGVVLNEFLPNPVGNDNASKPGGEWVKLYNNSPSVVDVNGWVLYDALNHPLVISSANADNNNNPLDSGETIIPSAGVLTVYLNGAYTGWLNNEGGDTLKLYNAPVGSGGALIDSFTYKINAAEGKSFKREPDGIGSWKDPEIEPVESTPSVSPELSPMPTLEPSIMPSLEPSPVASPEPLLSSSVVSSPSAVAFSLNPEPTIISEATPTPESPMPLESPAPTPTLEVMQ